MEKSTLQLRINAKKESFLHLLKKQGVYLHYCTKRGFVYEMIHSIYGQRTRLTVAINNGFLYVLSINPVTETAV